MISSSHLSINISGNLMDLSVPKVMGILNVTPDSFYSESRKITTERIKERIETMLKEGVDIIDIGGCSTRPGFSPPSIEEEIRRVDIGCRLIKEIAPEIPLSIDTYQSEVARHCLDKWQVNIINDISGGCDPQMWEIVSEAKAAYILTLNKNEKLDAGISDLQDLVADSIAHLAKKINVLHRMGVKDIIIDPGFGFAKNIDENFCIFGELEEFSKIGLPLLVGISRKSMIYKSLGITPEESLTGTVTLNAMALMKGADILRVHDVKEAVETVKLFVKIKEKGKRS